MNIITFDYTKKDSSVSKRVLAVMVSPNTMYEGIDITELEAPEQVMFLDEVNTAYAIYLQAITEIKAEFDVNHNYRRFDPLKMTNVVREVVWVLPVFIQDFC